MGTSLAEQLKRLEVPQTSLYKPKKKKLSLLFDPSEAASIDRDTFYSIGVSGLKELINVNKKFAEFENTLFDKNSVSFERSVETADVNRELNAKIKRFLYLLCPYFQLKSSHKALEWLIVRYRIHEYNVDDLMAVALPYHRTRFFARLLQLFDLINENDKYHWLYQAQKKGIPLTKSILLDRCIADASFLNLICDAVVDCVEVFEGETSKLSTVFAFYCTTVVGALQKMDMINDLYVTYILPSVLCGLKSDCIDFVSSSFIIVAALSSKIRLSKKVFRKLVIKITAVVTHVTLQNDVILLLNILYQSEKISEISVPKKAIRNLMTWMDQFMSVLDKFLSSAVYTNVFYLVLVRDSLLLALELDESESEDVINFVSSLLKGVRVDDSSAETLIRIMIENGNAESPGWYCDLVQSMEHRYPNPWDTVLPDLMKEIDFSVINHLLGLTSTVSQTELFRKLNDANPHMREEVVKYMASNPDGIKIQYLETSLKSRWNDDEPEIIIAMYELPAWMQYCSFDVTKRLLIKCWRMDNEEKWNQVLIYTIKKLSTFSNIASYEMECVIQLLPYLLTSTEEIQHLILDVQLPFFIRLKGNVTNNDMYKAVMENFEIMDVEQLLLVCKELPQNAVNTFTTVLIISDIFCNVGDIQKLEILRFIFEVIFPARLDKWKNKTPVKWNGHLVSKCYKKTKSDIFPTEILPHCVKMFVQNAGTVDVANLPTWFHFSADVDNVVVSLYRYLVSFVCSENQKGDIVESFIELFLKSYLPDLRTRLNFICSVCVAYNTNTDLNLRSFRLMNKLLTESNESYTWTLELTKDNVLVPTVLISLSSSNDDIRKITIDTLTILCSSISPTLTSDVTYTKLIQHILSRKEEILLDPQQASTVMYTFLSQEQHVQDLLPIATRIDTPLILKQIIDVIADSNTPTYLSAKLLHLLEHVNCPEMMDTLIPLVIRILENKNSHELTEDEFGLVTELIEKFNPLCVNFLHIMEMKKFIAFCLNCCFYKVNKYNARSYVQNILLSKLPEVFHVAELDMKQYILNSIFEAVVKYENSDLSSGVNSFIKKITLESSLIVPYLKDMKDARSDHNKKDVFEPGPEICNSTEWKKGLKVMELVQSKKKLKTTEHILPLLFEILHKCLEVDASISVEYAKQVCLSCILNCTEKLNVDENTVNVDRLFNVELIVNCIRTSQNLQTHHHALMVLSHCAKFTPHQVLHNIMSIFTFMGSSVLRQDDAFSFQIILNIMDTIIPLLAKTRDVDQHDTAAITVLRIFASSMVDIPEHRRVPLLQKLIKIIGEQKFLWYFVILALENEVCDVKTRTTATISRSLILQDICMEFDPLTIVVCCQQLLEYISYLPHDKVPDWNKLKYPVLFNLDMHSNKGLHHLKYLTLMFVSTLLSENSFISQFASKEGSTLKCLEEGAKGIIERVLRSIHSVSHYLAVSKSGSLKYWKAIISLFVEILAKVNALLSGDIFLNIVKDLLSHEVLLVRRKMLELLNWRLQQSEDDPSALKSDDDLILVIPSLMALVVNNEKNSDQTDEEVFENQMNQQTALISLKLITKHCDCVKYLDSFKSVLQQLSSMLKDERMSMNEPVLACLILCIAELTAALKVHSIEYLPQFLPPLMELLKDHNSEKNIKSDMVLLSIISSLQKVVESLPNFLSSFLEGILYEVTVLNAKIERQGDSAKTAAFLSKLKSIKQKISLEVATRVLYPAISGCLQRLWETKEYDAIRHLVQILSDGFRPSQGFSPELTNLLLRGLEFRCVADHVEDDTVDNVETCIIEAIRSIVLKCSETSFRPFYHKLYDWGVVSAKYANQRQRSITYYRTMNVLSESLKSLFVLFASNFIRNAAELLNKNNICKYTDSNEMYYGTNLEKSVMLIDAILSTLKNVFKHNVARFLTKERFDILLQPIIDQVENVIGDYEKRSQEIIVDCVAHFASATTDDSLWKQYIYQLLLKTRDNNCLVRLTALESVCKFAVLLGDNFLPFLPETVPFLAELLEDESELVEKRTSMAIQKLEDVLGEPIKKYF